MAATRSGPKNDFLNEKRIATEIAELDARLFEAKLRMSRAKNEIALLKNNIPNQ